MNTKQAKTTSTFLVLMLLLQTLALTQVNSPLTWAASANKPPVLVNAGGHYLVGENVQAGTVIGDIFATDPDAGDTLTYKLVSGAGFAVNSSSGELSVATPPTIAAGATRALTVSVSDGKATVQGKFNVYVMPTDRALLRGVSREKFEEISGDSVSDLTKATNFINKKPTSVSVESQVHFTSSLGNNYGLRYRGYISPSVSGTYHFWIASDDSSQFTIGKNALTTSLGKTPSAVLDGWVGSKHWSSNPTQKSIALPLVRGQLYYFEVLHKQGGGGNHVALAWKGPGMSDPVNGSASALVPEVNLIPMSAIDLLAPTTPPQPLLARVDGNSISFNWKAATDENGIAKYKVYRNNVFLADVTPSNKGVDVYTDNVSIGTYAYSVRAVDPFGNISKPATLKNIIAGKSYDVLELALNSGSSAALLDSTRIIDAIIAQNATDEAAKRAFLANFYPSSGTSFKLIPDRNYAVYLKPSGDALNRVSQVFKGNKCGADDCDKNFGVAGLSSVGTRFVAVGTIPFLADFTPAMLRTLKWLFTGSGDGTLPVEPKIALLQTQNYGERNQITQWLTTNNVTSANSITVCQVELLATCFSGKDLLIVGSNSGGGSATASALKTAMQQGVEVFYSEDAAFYENETMNAVGDVLGFEYDGMNYWANSKMDVADSADWIDSLVAGTHSKLAAFFGHLKTEDWDVDLSDCSGHSCPGGSAAKAYMDSEFYAVANDLIRAQLTGMDYLNIDLFKTPSTDYRIQKLMILLGDVYRRDVQFPVSKSNLPKFFRALYADYSVFNNRLVNPAQPDLGTFSKPLSPKLPKFSKSVSFTTRSGKYFTAAGVYALPGQTFTVQRTDSEDVTVELFINSLRQGTTKIMDSYNRPTHLSSASIELKKSNKVSITSPHGGPIQIRIAGKSPFVQVNLKFEKVGQHPVWRGSATTAAFKRDLLAGKYDWAELLTPGFEIHAKRDLMLESMLDPSFSTPDKLAEAAYNDFYITNYQLAGLMGPGLSTSSSIQALCTTNNWDCTNAQIHGIPSMNHFNSDVALCGYGCSGNPYDAYWAFSPLGWGDSHEMGHNLQSLTVTNDSGQNVVGEVSNNIFPGYVMYAWNKKYPDQYRKPTHSMDQDLYFKTLNEAQNEEDPRLAVADALWNGDEDNSFRVFFYVQLVQQAKSASAQIFGEGGWDVITMLYKGERLKWNAQTNETSWNQNKDKLGFSSYTLNEAKNIAKNDQLLILYSYITKMDQRPFFDLWGVKYSSKASQQVASFAYDSAPKKFYYFPVDGDGSALWTMDTVGNVDVDGAGKQLPHISTAQLITPNNAKQMQINKAVTLKAWVAGLGTVTFRENGEVITGCSDVATAKSVKTINTAESGAVQDYEATCSYTPKTLGSKTLSFDYAPQAGTPVTTSRSVNVIAGVVK